MFATLLRIIFVIQWLSSGVYCALTHTTTSNSVTITNTLSVEQNVRYCFCPATVTSCSGGANFPLAASTSYQIKPLESNQYLCYDGSISKTVIKTRTNPTPPTGITFSYPSTLTWNDTNNGKANYIVIRDSPSTMFTTAAGVSFYTFSPTFFSAGNTYAFSIFAYNNYTSSRNTTLQLLFPTATNFTSFSRFPNRITAMWNNCTEGANARVCISTSPIIFSNCTIIPSATTSYSFTTLLAAQWYYFSIQCISNSGIGSPISYANRTTTPIAASWNSIAMINHTTVQLQYKTVSDSLIGSNQQEYRYSINGMNQTNFRFSTFDQVTLLPNTPYSATLYTLDAVTKESATPIDISFVTGVVPPTLAPVVDWIGEGKIRISWTPITPYGNYALYFKPCIAMSGSSITCHSDTNATTYTFGSLQPSTNFDISYKIISDSGKESLRSPVTQVLSSPPTPIISAITTLNSSSVSFLTSISVPQTNYIYKVCIHEVECYSISNLQLYSTVIVLTGLDSNSKFSGNITTYDTRNISSFTMPLNNLFTASNLPTTLNQHNTTETSVNLTWSTPINSPNSNLQIVGYTIIVKTKQNISVLEVNTTNTYLLVNNLLPGTKYNIELAVQNGNPEYRKFNLKSVIMTRPQLPTNLSVVYDFSKVKLQWTSPNNMTDSWYRFELVNYEIWNEIDASGAVVKEYSLWFENNATLFITAQNSLFNSTTLIITRPSVINHVEIQMNGKRVTFDVESSFISNNYACQVRRMNHSVVEERIQSQSTYTTTLQYGNKYIYAVSTMVVIGNFTITSQVVVTDPFVISPLPPILYHPSITPKNLLTLQIQDHSENPSGGVIYLCTNSTDGKNTSLIALSTQQLLSVQVLQQSSVLEIRAEMQYADDVKFELPSKIVVTSPLPPIHPQLSLQQNNSQAKIVWESSVGSLDVTYPIALYQIFDGFSTTNTSAMQWTMNHLLPFSYFSLQIYSINTQSNVSYEPLQVSFYTHPLNTNLSILSRTADFMSLKWPIFDPDVYNTANADIIYLVTVSNSHTQKNYTINTSNTLSLFDLDQDSLYSLTIETIADYSRVYQENLGVQHLGGLLLTSGPSDPIEVYTLPAEYPAESPKSVTVNILSYSTVLISWNAIPKDKTGFARILRYGIQISKLQSDSKDLSESISTVYLPVSASVETNSFEYVLENLTASTQYQIELFGVNIKGNSPFSPSVSFVTLENTSELIQSNIGIAMAVIISTFVLLFCVTVIIIVVIVIVVLLIVKLRKSKADQYFAYDMNNAVKNPLIEMNEISSNQIIPYSVLNFKNSQVLGSGAQGTVVTALYHSTPVAVKCFPKVVFGVTSDFADFYNEVRILSKHSNHVNIIRFIGISEDNNQSAMCLITELCTNGNLSSYAEKLHHSNTTRIDWREVIQILQGVASGMSFLHSRQIAHRDLKCENILLDGNQVPKIIDFGFTKQMEQGGKRVENMTMNVGTAAYLAPEAIAQMNAFETNVFAEFSERTSIQSPTSPSSVDDSLLFNVNASASTTCLDNNGSKKLSYDMKCDVYSFAIMMYVLLTGNKLPYGKANDIQILHQMHKNPDTRPSIPSTIMDMVKQERLDWYVTLMKQCWQTDPSLRPQFAEMIQVFRQV